MKAKSRQRVRCFCAFCRSPRSVYDTKHIGLTNVLGAILLSMGISQVYYGTPDPRGLVVFCLLVVIGETFVYLRWRNGVICKLCGFDPVIYKKSPELAAERVRQFFAEQSVRPEFWLSASPLVEVYRQKREQEKRHQEIEAIYARLRGSSSDPNPSAVIKAKADENTSRRSHLQRT